MKDKWFWMGLCVAIVFAAFLFTLMVPTPAHAGWFDFVGDTAKAVSDAVWKTMLIKAVERSLPMLLLATTLIGAIASFLGAGHLAIKMHESAREAMKDNEITIGEWVLLTLLMAITLPVSGGLLWFGWFLALAANNGLSELMG